MVVSYIRHLFSTNDQKIKNYIFQGGSIKGISYIGALYALENDGIKLKNIKRIGGTSVGAITAALLSVGYDWKELSEELKSLDFQEFIDIPDPYMKNQSFQLFSDFREKSRETTEIFLKELSSLTDGFTRIKKRAIFEHVAHHAGRKVGLNLFSKGEFMKQADEIQTLIQYILDRKGLADGNKILHWVEEKIQVKTKITHATFGELNELHQKDPKKYKQLYLMGTNLNKHKSEIFSHEDTPNVIISDAVRISMSIPIVFRPHQCYEKKDGWRQLATNDLYVDGGLMDNYPIWLFDKKKYLNKYEKSNINSETLGFRLEPLKNIISFETHKGCSEIYENEKSMETSKNELIIPLIKCFYEKQNSDFNLQKEEHKHRTIFIEDHDISTLKFNLNQYDKNRLIDSGKNRTMIYLKEAQNNLKNENSYMGTIVTLIIAGMGVTWGIISSR
ncbi:unnamed protein product [Adineta steineri]|uniref:PNPLA domain-containing protein n=1 Tax=Adineta steineri TaxID=433720 RepID=A0A818YY60_9BILA|nr:unnamed protein product [Adineta steineri]CAF1399694.1 unnamed protein product [Adineta steineri]CAF3761047.1 unnamed protein product [Adineta steineri]CAF3840559.1 unnamed protein product [Adineta steineri]